MKNFKGLKLKGERQAVCWEIKLMPAFFSGTNLGKRLFCHLAYPEVAHLHFCTTKDSVMEFTGLLLRSTV